MEPAIELPEGPWQKDTTHFPEPLTPFGASLYMDPWPKALAQMAQRYGLMIRTVRFESFGGEVYSQAVGLNGKVETGSPPPWWVIGIVARLVPAMRRRLRAAARMLASGEIEAAPRRWEETHRPELEASIQTLVAVELASLDDRELEQHFDELLILQREGQRVHFELMMPYFIALYRLVVLCRDALGWDEAQTIQLVQGLSTTSSAPARELARLADRVRSRPAAEACVRARPSNLVSALGDVDSELADAVSEYAARWGMRTTRYDPVAPTLSEDPTLFSQLLTDAVLRSNHGAGAAREVREAALRRARELVRDRDEALAERFEAALSLASELYPTREDNVLFTDNFPCGLLRRAALEVGRRLVKRDRLRANDEAVWLELEELRRALKREDSATDLRQLVLLRRRKHQWILAHPGPALRGPPASPPPDLRGLPKAARETNGALLWAMSQELSPAAHPTLDADELVGVAASSGVATGRVRVIRDERDFGKLGAGEVLVCPVTTPSWSVLFANAAALVTDGGGVLAHAAIIAREHGIPAVLGTLTATRSLEDGQWVRVDGVRGRVTLLAQTGGVAKSSATAECRSGVMESPTFPDQARCAPEDA